MVSPPWVNFDLMIEGDETVLDIPMNLKQSITIACRLV